MTQFILIGCSTSTLSGTSGIRLFSVGDGCTFVSSSVPSIVGGVAVGGVAAGVVATCSASSASSSSSSILVTGNSLLSPVGWATFCKEIGLGKGDRNSSAGG